MYNIESGGLPIFKEIRQCIIIKIIQNIDEAQHLGILCSVQYRIWISYIFREIILCTIQKLGQFNIWGYFNVYNEDSISVPKLICIFGVYKIDELREIIKSAT